MIGIGVNLTYDADDFSRLGLVYASSLLMATNKYFSVSETAAAICNSLEPAILRLEEEGFECLRKEYARHCSTLGQRVEVVIDGQNLTGRAVDIAPNGGLLCDIDGEIFNVTSGEASIQYI